MSAIYTESPHAYSAPRVSSIDSRFEVNVDFWKIADKIVCGVGLPTPFPISYATA